MFFQRIYTPGLAINTYLLGDEKTKRCAVIDPTRHVFPYIVQAQNEGYEITDILETHVHADFVSGSKELKHQLNEKPVIHCSGMGGTQWIPSYADQIVQNGTQLIMGDLLLKAVHTPGHTPEHVIWVVYDKTRSSLVPWFVCTGDCLFVGSVGRTDLLSSKEINPLAKQLYYSLFEVLNSLPEFVETYPCHSEGSLCGKGINGKSSSTIGYERLFNPYFQKKPEEEWIKALLKGLPRVSPYFQRLKVLNLKGPPLLSSLKAAQWNESKHARKFSDLFLLDVRLPEAFASSHLKGSINIPVTHSFFHWAGWMLPESKPLGLIVENSHIAVEIVEKLRLIGIDQDIWWVPFSELDPIEYPQTSFEMIEAEEVAKKQQLPESLFVVDVRAPSEWLSGHIPGAQLIELNDLESSLQKIPPNQTIALVCRSGVRASLAASLLQKNGFSSVCNIRGGMQAWNKANLPLTPLNQG